jgi:hypothetical protein
MSEAMCFQTTLPALETVCFCFQYSVQNARSLAHQAKEEEDKTELNFTFFYIRVPK